ncbi:hypothetical protein MTO96_006944 [Rhipicephalus appendiculatus]
MARGREKRRDADARQQRRRSHAEPGRALLSVGGPSSSAGGTIWASVYGAAYVMTHRSPTGGGRGLCAHRRNCRATIRCKWKRTPDVGVRCVLSLGHSVAADGSLCLGRVIRYGA